MTRRPSSSFLDYLLIAINPALIMALVGSLVFFLLTVFYRGDFEDRLWFTFAMFVMATVCIARISIEEGRSRAVLFALPLALLTAFAVNQFTNLSVYFNLGLLALVWWSSDRLTWDCTVIDDEKDSTGAGLLQVLGWEGETSHRSHVATEAAPMRVFLEHWFPQRGAGHTPGVWVIYFSLAALPLFGMGQWFLPAEDARARSTAFLLLVVYVGSGLALLMTTTFLGLRRYLRQRGVEMPLEMAATWLSVGAVMIVALLLLAMLLPRPTGKWGLRQFVASNVRDSSWFGRGKEAAQGDQSGTKSGSSQNGEHAETQGTASQSPGDHAENQATAPGKNGTAKNASSRTKSTGQAASQAPSTRSSSDESSSKKSGSGDESSSGRMESGEKKNSSSQSPSTMKKNEEGARGSSSEKNSPQEAPRDQPPSRSQEQHKGSENSAAQHSAEQPPPQPPPPALESANSGTSLIGKLAELLTTLGRLLSYVLLATILLFFAWKYRELLVATLRQLWQEWLDFLERFWGKKKKVEAPVAPALPPSPTFPAFASFADPFYSGMAQRSSLADLIVYSFRAFEAWSRERGCPRNAEQTPLEFAQVVGMQQASIHREARDLADLYCQLAYARTAMPSDSLQKLSRLWREMTAVAQSQK